jgi:hypothetical protein
VPRRRPMVREPPRRARTPPRTPREKTEWRPARRSPPRAEPRRPEEPSPRDSRECWQCQEVGHISRNCPYIYRRDGGGTRPSGGDWRGEPMEVNATPRRERRRGGRRDRGLGDSEYSGGDTSTLGSESERDEKPGRPPRRWESPPVKSSPKEEEVQA